MQQGLLIYLGLAFGSSALVLALRIVAMLRPPRGIKPSKSAPQPRPAPRPSRRQVAAGWPGSPQRAARLP